MKRMLCPLILLLSTAVFADFPKEVTITGKTIGVFTVKELAARGLAVEDIPWQQNAARVYIEAINEFKALPQELDRDKDFAEALATFDLKPWEAQIEAFLKDNAKAFELMEQADRVQKCAWPINASEDPEGILLPHLSPLRRLAKALKVRAAWRFSRGEVKPAIDDCFVAMRMGDRVSKQPILISWLVGLTIENVALKELDRVVAAGRLQEAELRDIAVRLAASRPPADDLLKALDAERAWALEFAKYYRKSFQDMPVGRRIAAYATYDQAKTEANLKAVYNWFEKHAKLPGPQAYKPGNSWDTYAHANAGKWDLITRLFVPAVGRTRLFDDRRRVIFDLFELRVALERYRLAEKKYPETLDALVPKFLAKVPDDPFAAKSYRYKRTDAGFLLWSIGDDLKDDGGAETESFEPDIRMTQGKGPMEKD